eukprot:12915290-Prorocentrum_lima.AAC.1
MAGKHNPTGQDEPIAEPGAGRDCCWVSDGAPGVCTSSAGDGSNVGLATFWVDGVTPPNLLLVPLQVMCFHPQEFILLLLFDTNVEAVSCPGSISDLSSQLADP